MGAWLHVEETEGRERDALLVSSNNDRHHVLIGQWTLPARKCRTCHEVLDHGYMGCMNMNFGFTFTHHVDVHMKDDTIEQHPGHRGFSTYVRNKLLNAASFGNPTDGGHTAVDTIED